MTGRSRKDPARVLRDGDALDRAMVAAQRRVVIRHRQLGIPLVLWLDGEIVEVPPDSVELPELPPLRDEGDDG